MKQIFILFSVLLPWVAHAQSKPGRLWTEDQRKFLIAQLESSQRELIAEVEKLSEEQLHFRPDTTKWSIAQV